MLKKYLLVLAVAYTLVLAIFSLVQLSGLSSVGFFSFLKFDKVLHFLAYFVLSSLWFYVFYLKFNHNKIKSLLIASIASIIFGIIIEILQTLITNTRVADKYDVLANVSGVSLTVFIILFLKIRDVKKR